MLSDIARYLRSTDAQQRDEGQDELDRLRGGSMDAGCLCSGGRALQAVHGFQAHVPGGAHHGTLAAGDAGELAVYVRLAPGM